MNEVLQEVYASIKEHKARSILTGFGVAWGMFILIVLLGAGNGFRSGILNMFSGYASNSIWVTGQWVSNTTAGGVQSGSRIKFNEEIITKLKNRFREIKYISLERSSDNANSVGYKGNEGWFDVKGIEKDYMKIKSLEMGTGRFLNDFDYRDKRRVVVIGKRAKETLFEDEEPVGKYVRIAGMFFQVVGTLKEGTLLSMMEQNSIYMPNVTLENTFSLDREFFTFGALLHENTSVETIENEWRDFLSKEIRFDKNDWGALYINNVQLQVKAFNTLFNGIDVFLWVLGVCFLLSGMIGITNIMMVVVKERTSEIGIRKAIGATPGSIVTLILSESLIITIFFGIIGLSLGYMGMRVYNWIVSSLQTGQQVAFEKASIEWYVVLSAFLLLIISGIAAGIFPAQKAAKIMPVETLNKVV